MARYIHKVSGARVSVRDDKAMDSSWEPYDGSGDDAAGEGYDALTVPKLKAEIERRNEGRDEAALLPVDGKKADLVAVLQGDDAARTEQ